jgi:hypothetical protein
VDAELRTVFPGTDMIVEPLNICSSICAAEGSPETRGLSSWCSDFSVAFAALTLSLTLCRLMASKTLPIYLTSESGFTIRVYLWLITFAARLAGVP